jgi:hypothetical protein
VNADLDALDRGVIEAGQLAAQALSRAAALEGAVAALEDEAALAGAAVAALEAKVAKLFEVDSIMRRVDAPEPVLAAAERKTARRTRHLKAVK